MKRRTFSAVADSLLRTYTSRAEIMSINKLIKDQPKGLLEVYRKRASFEWKSMRLNMFGEEYLKFQNRLFELIETSPAFKPAKKPMTLDEHRQRCMAQSRALADNDFTMLQDKGALNITFAYDGGLPIITGLNYGMVPGAVISLGSERHSSFVEKFMTGEFRGCFALTEISHGTNVKGMRTTATYDKEKGCYIFNTPDFEAAKCWVGCLGKCATHAIVFAKLITPDGTDHGINSFIVQVRDPKTGLAMNGVTVGDMGEKIGLNGIDNGFVIFHNYPVPRINLLNKMCDVSEDGHFVPTVKDPNKRFGASLGVLSMGRINITNINAHYIAVAVTIALRYCTVRKQFSSGDGEELPVIEYQALNTRLMPLVALTFALQMTSMSFLQRLRKFQGEMFGGGDKEKLAAEGLEIHALSSSLKPLYSWLVKDAITDCRESCGGHGYLKIGRLGDLRNDQDASCTYEGENNVLLQQSSNWLTTQWPQIVENSAKFSPLGSADFLPSLRNIMNRKFAAKTMSQAVQPAQLLEAFEWLVCHYFEKTLKRLEQLKAQGHDNFSSRNDSQMFFARTLSLVYGERFLFRAFLQEVESPKWRKEEKIVLTKLCSLLGSWMLEKRLGDFYEGGYASANCGMGEFLRQGIIQLSRDLVDETMALVDVFAPPDSIVQSPLGLADGRVYEHLEAAMLGNKENLERPSWWRELTRSRL